MESRKLKNQGMNWISQVKRLAIYLRDGLACCYCGATVEDGATLTLDHLKPYSKGGSNHETNLVTCCHKCNSFRGNRSYTSFAHTVAAYINHGLTGEAIIGYIKHTVKRALNIAEAKAMVERRGSCFEVLKNISKKTL
jgi:hypothetical protein